MAKKILLKTTIGEVEDDWHIGRFSLLKKHLEDSGYSVLARDRLEENGLDTDLVGLPGSDVDQLWLFAVDVVGALTREDAAAINSFRARGGGVLITRDHQDMGASLLRLGTLGHAHHFHSSNCEPDSSRHCVDDVETTEISWPNYHSGANGDYQRVETPNPSHPLVQRADGSPIEYLPAHPHEGVVSVPDGAQEFAETIFFGKSIISNNTFGCAVAFAGEMSADGKRLGNAVAQSTFHHFVDPNLDPQAPLPSFCTEKSGSSMTDRPHALEDSLRYIENLAAWLS